MPRRGGRDRYRPGKVPPLSAFEKQALERELAGKAAGPPPIGRAARGTEAPIAPCPDFAVRGARVDYAAIIGQPATLFNVTITADPFHFRGVGWVTFIERVRGWVAVDALSPAGKDPA